MEADDVMASYADQFPGRVTLLTHDKDMRQCLSETCSIILDVIYTRDDSTGDMMPSCEWLYAADHLKETGISPAQWVEYQCLMGDSVDGIRGAQGIGEAHASNLIREFGTADAAIAAAKDGHESIVPRHRKALIEFEPMLDVTRKLVTLKTNLKVTSTTRIT